MPGTSNLLIISPDERLRDEIALAVESLGERPVVHFADDARRGVDAAKNRSPQLVIVELTSDLRSLTALAQEIMAANPETTLAAAFRPDSFGPDVSESAVLIESIRAGVKDFLRRPVSTAELNPLLERISQKALPGRRGQGTIISFISNKGGVGKSTTAVNAACGLALRHAERVLLVDGSLQLGTCASMLDVRPETNLADVAAQCDRLDETLLRELTVAHPSGLHLLAAPRDALDAARVDDETISRVLTVARRTYDFVLVDTFPLLDRVVMAVLDLSDRSYIVLENVVPTLAGAGGLLEVLANLEFPSERARIVLNRCTTIGGSLRPVEVATRLDRTIDHIFPFDRRIVTAANTGHPLALRPPRFSRFSRELQRLVSDIEALGRPAISDGSNGRHRNGMIQPAATNGSS